MLTRKQRDDWAKALRSGEYVQARCTYINVDEDFVNGNHKITKHCCLAVLACVVGQSKQDLLDRLYPMNVIDYEMRRKFIDLNDDNRYSFEQIADEVDKLLVSGK